MAITTLAGLAAGLQPPVYFQKPNISADTDVLTSYFYAAGSPPAAVAPSPGLNGAALTSYAGQIDFQNPASGNAYLAAVHLAASSGSVSGVWMLYDRLWHNSGINVTTTTEQAITSPTWPARDNNGATDGEGVFVLLEFSAGSTNAPITNTTLNYTNSAGTAGRTATLVAPAALNASSLLMFRLQDGDTGIRSVQGITLGTSYATGTMHLVAVRPIASPLPFPLYTEESAYYDAIALGFPRLYNDSVLFAAGYNGNVSAAPPCYATLIFAHG